MSQPLLKPNQFQIRQELQELILRDLLGPSGGENEIIDELRVMICDEERTTAYFTFSSQIRPSLHQFRIYGAKNGLRT